MGGGGSGDKGAGMSLEAVILIDDGCAGGGRTLKREASRGCDSGTRA